MKRFWNSLKPPPAVPGRNPEREPAMHPSGLQRLWNAIKPPPPVELPSETISPEMRLRRRRLLQGAAALVVMGGLAWGVHQYIASGPMRSEKVFQEGMQLMGAGDFKGADERFTEAVSIWPRQAAGYLQRGLARRSMNQVDAAVADFERAIGEDSNLGPAHTALGKIYRERGDLTRAMNEFTVAIGLNADADAFYQRGQVHESLGQHEQAIQDYDAAIHEQTDAPYVYRARAMARDAMGDHDDAEKDRRTADHLEIQYPQR